MGPRGLTTEVNAVPQHPWDKPNRHLPDPAPSCEKHSPMTNRPGRTTPFCDTPARWRPVEPRPRHQPASVSETEAVSLDRRDSTSVLPVTHRPRFAGAMMGSPSARSPAQVEHAEDRGANSEDPPQADDPADQDPGQRGPGGSPGRGQAVDQDGLDHAHAFGGEAQAEHAGSRRPDQDQGGPRPTANNRKAGHKMSDPDDRPGKGKRCGSTDPGEAAVARPRSGNRDGLRWRWRWFSPQLAALAVDGDDGVGALVRIDPESDPGICLLRIGSAMIARMLNRNEHCFSAADLTALRWYRHHYSP